MNVKNKVSNLLYASKANDSLSSHTNRTDSRKVYNIFGGNIPSFLAMQKIEQLLRHLQVIKYPALY